MTPITKIPEAELKKLGTRVPLESIKEPGTYLSSWTGHLISIPKEGFKTGRSPLIEIRGKEPFLVMKLSDDPYIALADARKLATDHDLPVNF